MKTKNKKKETSLKTSIVIVSLIMVIIPIIFTGVSLFGIKLYFSSTMGEQSFQAKVDPQIMKLFMLDTFVAVVIIIFICVFF